MAVGAFTALILDNTIPGTPEERGLTAWSAPAETDKAATAAAGASKD